MKSRTVAPKYTGPERVAYVLPQGVRLPKGRKSGRNVRQPGEGGYVLMGMGDSLAKTFTTHGAAAEYAERNGFKVKPSRLAR